MVAPLAQRDNIATISPRLSEAARNMERSRKARDKRERPRGDGHRQRERMGILTSTVP